MSTLAYAPGSTLADGRYELERIIGSGGMAVVWKAVDHRLGRAVAVKVIADTLAADPAYIERFSREARTAAGLAHPNLVQVYDYAANVPQPYLVAEYVDGGTLADRIARGPAGPAEVRAVAADILSALQCVHRAGILHRDIKPANVLIGSDGRARLTDFGIAHPENATRLTQTGHLIGTIRYLAPELIDGAPASRQSDLYAVGILLRELAGAKTDRDVQQLIDRLSATVPSSRPRSARQAQRLLDPPRPPAAERRHPGAPSDGTRRSRRPSAPRGAQLTGVELTPAHLAGLAALGLALVLTLVLLFNAASTPGDKPAAPARNVTLDQRFDQLDRLVTAAG